MPLAARSPLVSTSLLSVVLLFACATPNVRTAPPESDGAPGKIPARLRGGGDGPASVEKASEDTERSLLSLDSAGWTQFPASSATRTVYVSSSLGNDTRTGLAPEAPVRTLAAGKARLLSGQAGRMLLRRGDTWQETLGQWRVGGRAADRPLVVGSYGEETARPLLRTGTDGGLHTGAYGDSPARLRDVAFVGLHFQASGYDGEGMPAGVAWRLPTDRLLFEDCFFEGYGNNVVIEAVGGRSSDVRIRRCVIVDAFTTGDEHAQGLYLFGIDGLTIEECVIHHNGWRDRPDAQATIFRHNVYVQNGNRDVRVVGNLIAEAGSHGLQLRPGGEALDNLFVANPISLMLGSKTADDVQPVLARDNVILDGRDINAENPRGWGIEVASVPRGRIVNNLIAHRRAGGFPLAINVLTGDNPLGLHDLAVRENIVYRWGGPTFLNGTPARVSGLTLERNELQDEDAELLVQVVHAELSGEITASENRLDLAGRPASTWIRLGPRTTSPEVWFEALHDKSSTRERVAYPAPERDLAGYAEALGIEGGRDGFLRAARGQSRQSWRPELTARAANRWLRAGFGR